MGVILGTYIPTGMILQVFGVSRKSGFLVSGEPVVLCWWCVGNCFHEFTAEEDRATKGFASGQFQFAATCGSCAYPVFTWFFLETHSRSKLLKVERNSTNGIWSPPAKSLAKWAIVSAGSPSLVSSVACFKVLPSLTYWAIVAKHSISLSCCASSAGGQALGTSDKCRTGVRA